MSDGSLKTINHAGNLYKPPSWLAKFAFINQIMLGTNVLVSIFGEQGSGKTSFITLFQSHIDNQIQPVYIAATASFDDVSFMNIIGERLQHKGDNTFDSYIQASQKRNKHQLVIIDNAHYLTEQFVSKMLFSLKKQGLQGYFHICLIADNRQMDMTHAHQIADTADKPGLMDWLGKLERTTYNDMIHTIDIGHLNEKETKDYILHRSSELGLLVSDKRVAPFYQLTGGHIAQINLQMADFFNKRIRSAQGQETSRPFKKNQSASLVVGAVMVALGLAFFLQPSDNLFHPPSEHLAEASKSNKDAMITAQAEPLVSRIAPYDLAAVRQVIHPTELRRVKLVMLNEEEMPYNQSMVVMDKVVVIPKIVSKTETTITKSDKKTKHKGIAQNNPSVRLLKNKPHNRYTIQLLASSNLPRLQQFARLHHIENKVHIHQTSNHGKPWYILTMGEYTGHDVAKANMAYLPDGLAKFKPWIRRTEGLQMIG